MYAFAGRDASGTPKLVALVHMRVVSAHADGLHEAERRPELAGHAPPPERQRVSGFALPTVRDPMARAIHGLAYRVPGLVCRSSLAQDRISSVNSWGTSMAGKCPPQGMSFQRVML